MPHDLAIAKFAGLPPGDRDGSTRWRGQQASRDRPGGGSGWFGIRQMIGLIRGRVGPWSIPEPASAPGASPRWGQAGGEPVCSPFPFLLPTRWRSNPSDPGAGSGDFGRQHRRLVGLSENLGNRGRRPDVGRRQREVKVLPAAGISVRRGSPEIRVGVDRCRLEPGNNTRRLPTREKTGKGDRGFQVQNPTDGVAGREERRLPTLLRHRIGTGEDTGRPEKELTSGCHHRRRHGSHRHRRRRCDCHHGRRRHHHRRHRRRGVLRGDGLH